VESFTQNILMWKRLVLTILTNVEKMHLGRRRALPCMVLIDAILDALKKSLNAAKTEIIVVSKIKEEIMNIKRRIESGDKQ